jgi:hypothetical protein
MDDSPQMLAKIEELVSQYKKQLMEELQASLDEKEDEAIHTPQAMIKILLDMKTEENTPLEKLLLEKAKKAVS